jgi:hypothetical protein
MTTEIKIHDDSGRLIPRDYAIWGNPQGAYGSGGQVRFTQKKFDVVWSFLPTSISTGDNFGNPDQTLCYDTMLAWSQDDVKHCIKWVKAQIQAQLGDDIRIHQIQLTVTTIFAYDENTNRCKRTVVNHTHNS